MKSCNIAQAQTTPKRTGKNITTHLLSTERDDWPKLHDMFKARDAKSMNFTYDF